MSPGVLDMIWMRYLATNPDTRLHPPPRITVDIRYYPQADGTVRADHASMCGSVPLRRYASGDTIRVRFTGAR